MATKTFEELKQLAIQIRDEKTNKQNTATRVGTAMLEHINKLEQDYYDKTTINNRTSEYNVSINHPTSGISSSNKYDLSSAIAQVPAELRTDGLTVSFLNKSRDTEKWEFGGGSWAVSSFEQVGAGKLTELSSALSIMTSSNVYIKDGLSKKIRNFYSGEVGSQIVENDSNYNSFLPVSCKKGDKFTICTVGGQNGVAYYVTDSSGIILSADDKSQNYLESPKTIEISEDNASLFYVNCIVTTSSTDSYNKVFLRKENSEITNINEDLTKIDRRISFLEDRTTIQDMVYAKDGGEFVKTGNVFFGDIGSKVTENGSAYNSFYPIPCTKGDKFTICTKGGANGVAYYITDEENIVLSMDSKSMDYLDGPKELYIQDEGAAYLYINIIVMPTSTDDYNKVYYQKISEYSELKDRITNLENQNKVKITEKTTEYFKVKVTGKPWLSDNNFESKSEDTLIDDTEYDDNCIYYQPECKESPVKLVIACHGGSQYVGSDESEGLNMGYPLTILQKLGYAYLCCNCYPYDYMHGVLGIGTGALSDSAPVGNWTIMQAYSKALNYVLNKYNIDKDNIFLMGVSQGGMTAENIAELMDINFKAECILEPAISMQFVQPSIRGSYLQAMYGFSTSEDFTIDKVHGLDPFSRNTDSETGLNKNSTFEECVAITTRKYRKGSPLLILQGDADVTVPAKWTAAYAKMIQNAGGQCEYILYEGLGHGTLQGGNKGTLDGVQFGAPCIELAKWFEKFGGYSTENIVIV